MALSQLTRSRARIADGLIPHVAKIGINAAPTGATQNTRLTLPSKAVVLDVFLDVRVAEVTGTTKTLDVGRTSDPDGYLASVSVATTGLKKGSLANGAQTRGALLFEDEDGAGGLVPSSDVGGGGETVVYDADDVDWVEFRGDIYVVYLNLV